MGKKSKFEMDLSANRGRLLEIMGDGTEEGAFKQFFEAICLTAYGEWMKDDSERDEELLCDSLTVMLYVIEHDEN